MARSFSASRSTASGVIGPSPTSRKLHFPLLADFEPKGGVARAYGVYRPGEGTSERALFVLDADGVVRWATSRPSGVNPGADGILEALEEIDQRSEKEEQP